MRALTRILVLAAAAFGLSGCLGSPVHNREHIRQIKKDLYGMHADFDAFWILREPMHTDYPLDR